MKATTIVLILLLALVTASCSRPQSGSTTVLLVRHAEKASDADDSPLTDVGSQRAQALVRVAEDSGASAIYTSQFKRTHDTAKPLSERLGVGITEAPVNSQGAGEYGKTLARSILEKHAGQTVVVVGHSNTIGATIEGLTGRAWQIGDVQYGELFIVTVPAAGAASVIKARFGL